MNFIFVTSCKFSIILMLITGLYQPILWLADRFFIRINKDFIIIIIIIIVYSEYSFAEAVSFFRENRWRKWFDSGLVLRTKFWRILRTLEIKWKDLAISWTSHIRHYVWVEAQSEKIINSELVVLEAMQWWTHSFPDFFSRFSSR